MTKSKETDFASIERIAQSIHFVRGQRVLLDSELAALYGVTTARLNQQVRRNLERFPCDFMFQLTADEHNALMLQIATSKPGRGGRRKPPLAFSEHGAIMAATVLNSSRAVEVSIYVVRAFVQFRTAPALDTELSRQLTKLRAEKRPRSAGNRARRTGGWGIGKKLPAAAVLRSQIVILKAGVPEKSGA